ncbi:occludin/ELL domain-containing protein 1 isoform X2 [Phocoena sinus]|uniref:occludin/ELL domain-containing protein 1 isoform X2 n=1 Tax=Phocoena sinus TaxID=42100 RepID=UPI0013C50D71|nr:occludin/ELL domain-containing protein 1 isoform X2 [Phocoena sinus]
MHYTDSSASLRERTQTRSPIRWDSPPADHPRHARATTPPAGPAHRCGDARAAPPRSRCPPGRPRRPAAPGGTCKPALLALVPRKYPPVSNEKDRSRYAAVFQDQYPEFLELQQEVGSAQAKLQQLEALLNSLPPPRSQKEAHVAARVWREFEKKQLDPSFLDKQARCHYLKGKLRHLKTQIQKFDDQGDSEGSVYF